MGEEQKPANTNEEQEKGKASISEGEQKSSETLENDGGAKDEPNVGEEQQQSKADSEKHDADGEPQPKSDDQQEAAGTDDQQEVAGTDDQQEQSAGTDDQQEAADSKCDDEEEKTEDGETDIGDKTDGEKKSDSADDTHRGGNASETEQQKGEIDHLNISFPCQIQVSLADDQISTFIFDQETITIGRDLECDISIDNLGASRIHAEIKRFGYFYIFYDKSKTGSFVHGRKVKEHHLNDGEEIFLAKHTISFRRIPPEERKEQKETGKKPKDSLSSTPERLQTVRVNYHSMAKKQGPARAYIQTEEQANRPIPIYKNATFLGKSGFCDIIIPGWFINNPHAVIVQEDTGFSLFHLGILNTPKVNGETKKIAVLKHGDTVEIGNFRFIFQSLQADIEE